MAKKPEGNGPRTLGYFKGCKIPGEAVYVTAGRGRRKKYYRFTPGSEADEGKTKMLKSNLTLGNIRECPAVINSKGNVVGSFCVVAMEEVAKSGVAIPSRLKKKKVSKKKVSKKKVSKKEVTKGKKRTPKEKSPSKSGPDINEIRRAAKKRSESSEETFRGQLEGMQQTALANLNSTTDPLEREIWIGIIRQTSDGIAQAISAK